MLREVVVAQPEAGELEQPLLWDERRERVAGGVRLAVELAQRRRRNRPRRTAATSRTRRRTGHRWRCCHCKHFTWFQYTTLSNINITSFNSHCFGVFVLFFVFFSLGRSKFMYFQVALILRPAGGFFGITATAKRQRAARFGHAGQLKTNYIHIRCNCGEDTKDTCARDDNWKSHTAIHNVTSYMIRNHSKILFNGKNSIWNFNYWQFVQIQIWMIKFQQKKSYAEENQVAKFGKRLILLDARIFIQVINETSRKKEMKQLKSN